MPLPHGRDLELTGQRLTAWLGERLDAARDLKLSKLAGPDATGFSNDTLLFDATWREDGKERSQGLVARIEPGGFPIFPEYDIARQFQVMHALAETDVPVPRTFWFEASADVLGAPFYVMERVEGRIPTDNPPYHVGGWVTELAPEERTTLWWSGLDVLASIHRQPWKELGFGGLEPGTRGTSPLEQQLAYYERYLEWAARGRPQPVCEAALAWLGSHRPQGREPVALCWGDARLGNMVFRDQRCVAVLDWEMVALGNPVADLAWWLFLDRHHSEGCGFPRLAGFPSREETVARYEEQVGAPVEHLAYYEIFAAFRFAVIMIRVAQQLAAYELLPEDSDFETNNIVTRLLASSLDLPPPG